jgi:hypothetical protein
MRGPSHGCAVCLAGPVGPEVPEGRAGGDAQVDAVNGDPVAEALGEPSASSTNGEVRVVLMAPTLGARAGQHIGRETGVRVRGRDGIWIAPVILAAEGECL